MDDDQKRLAEARAAAERAKRALEQVQARSAEVREVASWLRLRRQENHFAELIRRALRGT